ncbi:MAG TPA: metallophosphoesterase [Usitatibacter sp.]|nr:metallophosphoesterase [Usitatibacter sp.]
MRTLAHLSDLHFGRVHPPVLEPLRQALAAIRPDLVVVSGDLTQRARAAQFREAREFLDSLPFPRLVVPGNHDIPLYNVVKRFTAPLRDYKRIVSHELCPTFDDAEMVVVGVNTARSLVFKGGRIGRKQMDKVRAAFAGAQRKLKVIVTHHPFDGKLAHCGADLLLSGHLHEASVDHAATGEGETLAVQAGTATSSRTRETANSFNAIRATPGHVEIETHQWSDGAFQRVEIHRFDRAGLQWRRAQG